MIVLDCHIIHTYYCCYTLPSSLYIIIHRTLASFIPWVNIPTSGRRKPIFAPQTTTAELQNVPHQNCPWFAFLISRLFKSLNEICLFAFIFLPNLVVFKSLLELFIFYAFGKVTVCGSVNVPQGGF